MTTELTSLLGPVRAPVGGWLADPEGAALVHPWGATLQLVPASQLQAQAFELLQSELQAPALLELAVTELDGDEQFRVDGLHAIPIFPAQSGPKPVSIDSGTVSRLPQRPQQPSCHQVDCSMSASGAAGR